MEVANLAQRAMAGETAATEELLRELQPFVVRAVRLIVGSTSPAAEDAAQEALLDISRGLKGLRDPRAVRAWAIRVASQRALKVARRERLRLGRFGPSLEEPAFFGPDGDRRAAIKECFDRLPPRLRATAVLRLHLGLTEQETAEAMGCSVGTVKSNLHDARRQLTSALAERGFSPMTSPKEVL